MQLSKRIFQLETETAFTVLAKANKLASEGKDIINLGIGQPDFATPINVQEAAIKAIKDGDTKYTAVDGTPALKQAIVDKFKRENNLNYTTDQITVGAGGKQVIYNLMMATLNKGDEVIIPAPYWVSYPDIVSLCGGKPIIVETTMSENFKITPQLLEKKISNKTKWFIINSPCNPTGAVYSKEEIKELSSVLLKYPSIMILSDDIYEHIIYEHKTFKNILNVEPKLFDRTFIVNGVSKAYSMTGWRIGYGAGPQKIIKAIAKIQSQSTTNPCSISQMAASRALDQPKDFLKDWLKKFEERRNYLLNFFNSIEGFEAFQPEGAFYLFVSCGGFINKKTKFKKIDCDFTFCEFLLDEVGVAVVPGEAFGVSPFFRISYATSLENIKEACVLISEAINKLK